MDAWKQTKLGAVLTLKRGYDLPASVRETGNYSIISSSGPSDNHAEFKVKGPGVVTGRYGTLGQIFYTEADYWPLNTTLYVQDFKGNDPKFIYYFLHTLNLANQNDKSAVPGLNRNHLHELPVLFPPLSEQRLIAAILSSIDDKIALNQLMNQTLEQLAQTQFRQWFVADMDEREHESLSALVEFDPKTPVRKGTQTRFLPMAEVPTNGFAIGKLEERPYSGGAKFKQNDTLLARITPCLENGKTAYVDFLHADEVAAGSTEFIVMRGRGKVPSQFVYCLARSVEFRQYAIAQMVGTSGRQRVAKELLEYYSFPVPNESLLIRFGDIAQVLFAKISANNRQSRTLATLRDKLLPQLLSGSLTVRQAEELLA